MSRESPCPYCLMPSAKCLILNLSVLSVTLW